LYTAHTRNQVLYLADRSLSRSLQRPANSFMYRIACGILQDLFGICRKET